MKSQALLSSGQDDTVFRYGNDTIRFKAPFSLERYTDVKGWDHGYIVAMAKYNHNEAPGEEYIDLIPVLKDLSFDTDTFLDPIREVKVSYD